MLLSRAHNSSLFTRTFEADGEHIVSGAEGGEIHRWMISNGTQQGSSMKAAGVVDAIAVSMDDRWIVSGDRGKRVIVWNAVTHEKATEFAEHADVIWGVDISRDSTRVVSVSGGSDPTARVFDRASGRSLLSPMIHPLAVTGVKFSPDGKRFATVIIDKGSVRVYNANTGEILTENPINAVVHQTTPLAWSPCGQRLFSVSPGRVSSLNLSTSSRSEWSIHSNESRASVVTNGKFVACSAGTSVSFWDPILRAGIDVISPVQHTAKISCIALSANERYLACGYGSIIAIHNLRDILPPRYFSNFTPLMQVTDVVLEQWTQGHLENTQTILSGDITRSSDPNHYALANRSLVRVQLNQLGLAIVDATESLQIRPTPIGHIAMALVLLRQGDRDGAELRFQLVFHDCEPGDNRLLLLLQAIVMFECGKQDTAIERVEFLLAGAADDAAYPHHQVLGAMHMKRGEYGPAISAFDRAKQFAPLQVRSPPLVTISLIFGWTFEELDVTARKRLYEITYAKGRVDEAAVILQSIIQSSVSRPTADWIVDFHQIRAAEAPDSGTSKDRATAPQNTKDMFLDSLR